MASSMIYSGQKLKNVKCLVTGAGGFLGTSLVKHLISEKAIVSGFGREPIGRENIAGLRWIHGEFSEKMSLMRACEGQDIVFHLLNSSTPASSTMEPVGDIISNLVPSIVLLECCVVSGVKKVIFASSGGTVYGLANGRPVNELNKTEPISAYGIAKLTVEHYLRLFRKVHGLDYNILRVSNPYGPGQSPFKKQGVVAAFMYSMIKGLPVEIWGDGSVIRDYIYIDDVSRAFVGAAYYTGEEKIFNVSSGFGIKLVDIYNDINDRLGLNHREIIWREKREVDVPYNVLSNNLIKSSLSWSPEVDFKIGLDLTSVWIRSIVSSE